MDSSRQVFGLTISTGNVEGEVIRYSMDANGVFSSLPTDLDGSAIDALTPDELEALKQELRAASFTGFYRPSVQS